MVNGFGKLEECLDLDLVKSALSYVDGYEMQEPVVHMVAEPDPPEYGSNKQSGAESRK